LHEGEKLTFKKLATIIAGIAGVILISAGRQAFKLGTIAEIAGVVLILGANISTATSNVMVSIRSRGVNPMVLNCVSLFVGGIIIYLISIPLETAKVIAKPAEYWISLLWLSIVASAAFSLWYWLLQRPHVKVSELNLWKFIIPVIGAILSWILVPGESPDWLTVSGMLIISASLVLFYKNGSKKAHIV
jgi:drug/metabolite transporter (DMT)-like permease